MEGPVTFSVRAEQTTNNERQRVKTTKVKVTVTASQSKCDLIRENEKISQPTGDALPNDPHADCWSFFFFCGCETALSELPLFSLLLLLTALWKNRLAISGVVR